MEIYEYDNMGEKEKNENHQLSAHLLYNFKCDICNTL